MIRPFHLVDVQSDFPILQRPIRGQALTYLDSAATTLKPESVVDRVSQHYLFETSNIHRGVYHLSEQATLAFESVRETVARFLGAPSFKEIVFTRGTTESINLVASCLGRIHFKSGDEILITHMEHHSNIVPWQMLAEERGLVLRVAQINDRGELDLEDFQKKLSPRTRLVSIVHVSNSLGTINPIADVVRMSKNVGALVLVDGAQAVSTTRVNVSELGCDFYCFSGHKLFGPTGVGVLWGRAELLEKMPPYQGGGDMIASVTFEKTLYNVIPYKFEAGTPAIAEVIGLGAAIDYFTSWSLDSIMAHEKDLLAYGTERLREVDGLRIVGTAGRKVSILSFVFDDIHPHDIGTLLDQEGICVRTGHHCTQPVMQRFQVPATTRASLSIYNSREDIDALVAGLLKVKKVFQ